MRWFYCVVVLFATAPILVSCGGSSGDSSPIEVPEIGSGSLQTEIAQDNATATEEAFVVRATQDAFARNQTATAESGEVTATVRAAGEQATARANDEISNVTATAQARDDLATASVQAEYDHATATTRALGDATATAVQAQAEADQLFQEMEAAAERGDWAAAFQYADRIVAIDPSFREVSEKRNGYVAEILEIARALSDQGDWPSALEHLELLTTVDPNNQAVNEVLRTARIETMAGPPASVYDLEEVFPNNYYELPVRLTSIEILSDRSVIVTGEIRNPTANEMQARCRSDYGFYLTFGADHSDETFPHPASNYYCPDLWDRVRLAPGESVTIWSGFAPLLDAGQSFNVHLSDSNVVRAINIWDLWRAAQ